MRRFWILVSVVIVLLALSAAPTLAQDGRFVVGRDVEVASGQTIPGDLVVVGGDVRVVGGGEVDGSLTTWGGDVTIAGRVRGNVTAWGGDISLQDSSVVAGDVVVAGGRLHRDSGATVEGDIVDRFLFREARAVPVPPLPALRTGTEIDVGTGSVLVSFILNLLKIGFTAAGLAVIALLVLIFMPEQTNMVKQMTIEQPVASVGVGILTMLVAALVVGILVITICGIPIALIVGLALLMAMLYGWIALGLMVGERLLSALDTQRPLPLIAGMMGVLLITLLSSLPCLGWLLAFVGGSWGLGAVILSRGGTRRHPALPGGRTWQSVPTAPPSPEGGAVTPPAVPEEPAEAEGEPKEPSDGSTEAEGE